MPSFDIVSKVQWNEVDNALNQSQKEIAQRFDFKDTGTSIERNDDGISLRSSSDERVKAAYSVLQDKLIKRKVSLKHLDPQKPEPTGKGGSKMLVKVKEGIDGDHAKDLVRRIKDSKIKVQASIQEAQVRVSGKNRDDLQAAIQLVKEADLPLELQFINFRD
ncbi:YajQ family cyclic di-GMP-binding protein [Pendulispora brunnea]|uniref:Nucleotide-binding protein LZC95_11135 n=1 Tax=Pendulispora brunnea TaxID=2905690 RepID=A0ABZ2KIG8_9BACT